MVDDAPQASETVIDRRSAVDWAIIFLAGLAFLTALAVARVFLVPVILALLLALVFSPLCRWMWRRGIPEALSAAVIVLLLLVGILATTTTLAVPVSTWIQDAPQIAREVEWKLRSITGIAEAMMEASEKVEEATQPKNEDGSEPVEVVLQERGPLSVIAFNAPLIAGQTVFVLILLYFVLASGDLFYERLVRVMPTFADKRRAIAIARDIERDVSRYLLSITAINAGLGVCVGIAMALLGMPNPLLFGLLAFALNFVPFLGALIGTALTFTVALVSLPTAFDAFLVAATFWGLTAIEGQFVTPMLVGRKLQLNTVVILVAVAFWAWLWSIMGMLMAVPLLVSFRVLCRHVPQLRPVEQFLSARETEGEG